MVGAIVGGAFHVRSFLTEPGLRASALQLMVGFRSRRTAETRAEHVEQSKEIIAAVQRLRVDYVVNNGILKEEPPRRVAVAMAMTWFTQPHLATTLARGDAADVEPVHIPIDKMSEVLGLPVWELEELQMEADRRVGSYLKQQRALSWMWERFGLPKEGVAALLQVLFPGMQGLDLSGFSLSRRGAQLYAVVGQSKQLAPETMHLAWLNREGEGAYAPRGTFGAKYVDLGLRQTLGRAIGSEPDEVLEILDRMVSVVSRSDAPLMMQLDRWRSDAFEAVCDLSGPYPMGAFLSRIPSTERMGIADWMVCEKGAVRIDHPKAFFDRAAMERVVLMVRQMHSYRLARAIAGLPFIDEDELDWLDVEGHIRTVVEPVLAWAAAPDTVAEVAQQLGCSEGAASDALSALHRSWSTHFEQAWVANSLSASRDSVALRVMAQMLRAWMSSEMLDGFRQQFNVDHQLALRLFAGHYFAELPLGALWGRDRDRLAEDPIGQWFWPAWRLGLTACLAPTTADTFQY